MVKLKGIPPCVRALPNFNIRGLGPTYFPGPAFLREEHDVHLHVDPVRQLRAKRSFERRVGDPAALYWKFTANTSQKQLKLGTQRSRLRRQWSEAFAMSLLKHGMNRRGKSLEASRRPKGASVTNVAGTLEVAIYDGFCFGESVTAMTEHTDEIVTALMRFHNQLASPVRQEANRRPTTRLPRR